MEKEYKDLVSFLEKNGVKYQSSEHGHVRTSEQAAAVRSVPLQSGVKALVFKVQKEKHSELAMVLVRGDHKVDNGKLCSLLNARNAKLASPEEVLEKTGCEVGSVHPFGNLFGLPVYMDKLVMENKEVNFSAGMHTKSVNMKAEDMVKLIRPAIADIAKK